MSVGIVLVSHSRALAEGLAELAAQMAPDVPLIPAGGRGDGGIGTSYDRVDSAVQQLLGDAHPVLILTDLGSATMTVETLIDMLDDAPVRFVDAPFVEGAVAAAVAAQQGETLDGVARAAASAAGIFSAAGEASGASPEGAPAEGGPRYTREVTVVDAEGLHARPAAAIAEMAAEAHGDILLNDVDAASSLLIMALGVQEGARVTLASDPQDKEVVDRIADAIAAGLDH